MSSIFKKLLKKSSKKRQAQDRTRDRHVGNESTGTEDSDSDTKSAGSGVRQKRRLKRLILRHRGGADGADGGMEMSSVQGEAGAAAGGKGGEEGYSVVEMALMEDDDLKCSCCYELMVEPTTLNCGHSFCRHCLALWLNQGKQHICPQCRSVWMGFPQINYTLR